MISTPGCCLNQLAKVSALRSSSTSTGWCVSQSMRIVPYVCPRAIREIIHAKDSRSWWRRGLLFGSPLQVCRHSPASLIDQLAVSLLGHSARLRYSPISLPIGSFAVPKPVHEANARQTFDGSTADLSSENGAPVTRAGLIDHSSAGPGVNECNNYEHGLRLDRRTGKPILA